MKPYGLPRHASADVDCAGIREHGRATRLGKLPGPSGDARAMQRPAAKASARRRLARLARAEGNAAITSAINE